MYKSKYKKTLKLIKYQLLIFTLIFFAACNKNPDSPEEQIKGVIASIEQGIEDRSLSQVIKHLDDNYLDHKGRTKQDLKRYLQLQILRNQNITILSKIKSINITENTASVELSSASAAKGTDLTIAANRLKANIRNVSLVLKHNSGAWKVVSASWNKGLSTAL